jgi:hypothetical protein
MTWLTPLLAGVAAAIAIPTLLILYFLKLRRRDVEVSTTLLWKKSIQDMQANAPFQKLRRNILLILQLIILAAALIALGQPQLKSEAKLGEKHIILLDRSASMATLDTTKPGAGGQPVSRLDAAKAEAIAFVDGFREPGVFTSGEADQAMVIAFDGSAEVRQNFTSDKRAIKAAIESVQIVEGPGRLKEAIRLAKAHAPTRLHQDRDGTMVRVEGMTAGPVGTIHLWSDGRLSDAAEAATGPEDKVVYHKIGTSDAINLGITSIRAERAYDNQNNLSVFVGIQSTEKQVRTIDAELLIDGQLASLQSVRVNPAEVIPPADEAGFATIKPGTGGVVFRIDRSEGALAQVRLRQPGTSEPPAGDLLDIDNRAWIVVPPARRMAVAAVTTSSPFLRTALEGMSLSRADVFTPAEFQKKIDDRTAGEYDVVILDGWLPNTSGLAATGPQGEEIRPPLPPGRFIVLNAVPQGIPGVVEKEKVEARQIVNWQRAHPALRAASFDNVLLFEGITLVDVQPGAMADVIAMSDRGPAIIEATGDDWQAIIVPFNLAGSNWPFEVSFIVWTAMTISYLGGDAAFSGDVQANLLRPGEELSDRIPLGSTGVTVQTPGGDNAQIQPARDGRISFGPVDKTGVYLVGWTGNAGVADLSDGGKVRRPFAANLMDGFETNVAAAEQIALAGAVVSSDPTTTSPIDRKLWPYLILAALGVLMIEWFVYNKKVHV